MPLTALCLYMDRHSLGAKPYGYRRIIDLR
jgi:hypothetical protein